MSICLRLSTELADLKVLLPTLWYSTKKWKSRMEGPDVYIWAHLD